MTNTIEGPFGSYKCGSLGAALNALVRFENVPLSTVERLRISSAQIHNLEEGRILAEDSNTEIGIYKWFEGIDRPLFLFTHSDYVSHNKQRFTTDETGREIPDFRLQLSVHMTPCFQIDGEKADTRMCEFLHGMFTNYMDDPRYKLSKAAQAFFQGGSHDPAGQWFMIEFWRPEGAQAWIDYMNQHYANYEELGLYKD